MTTESQMMDATMSMGANNIATSSRTNAPPTMAPAEKPEKFSGIDFKRWQQKMFFYLTTLCLQRFTSEDDPEVPEGTSDKDRFVIWNQDIKRIVGALERKYKMEDAGIKKFLVARFLNFKMIDSKSVVSQVQDLQVIIHDLLAEVAAIVEKLAPLWKDFKNYLKHKRKEMTVEDLIVRLRIEEDNKAAKRRSKGNSTMNGAHIVEDGQNNSKKRNKVEHGSNQPKKKFKGKCFNCGKIGHKSTDCQAPKKGNKKDQANMIESNKEYDDLCAMFTECNLVGNPREWWMDSGATRHVCANKELFSSFAPAQAEEMFYMTNSATDKVEETGKICLKMTSGKVLTLNNVLYVPELRRNLISVSLLDKNGFKCVTVSGKIVVSKGERYVGKGYLTEVLYKMNVMIVEMNKSSNSSYLLESYDL
ncbi:putative phosphoserine aminotransferase, chloroplastic-like [Capsicum annuum]|nr:putative phosphoserine aminotransferase, chloroplastic-like [Capsicum annuum]